MNDGCRICRPLEVCDSPPLRHGFHLPRKNDVLGLVPLFLFWIVELWFVWVEWEHRRDSEENSNRAV